MLRYHSPKEVVVNCEQLIVGEFNLRKVLGDHAAATEALSQIELEFLVSN